MTASLSYVRTALTLAALGVLLASTEARADDAPVPAVTFARDIAPIFYSNCVSCHRPGQAAPMSLLSYKDIRPFAKSIKKAVSEKTMPPWFAAGETSPFSNDHRLKAEQIALISNWVDQGAPLGDPLDMPPTPQYRDEAWQIGKPDAVFKMTKPFQLPDGLSDHYEDIVVPTRLTEDKWVTKIELKAGNVAVVHHILVFVVPGGGAGAALGALGGDLFGAALLGGGFLAKYAPGNNPDVFEAGYGKLIPAGSNLLFQIHYHKDAGAGTATTDQSMVGVVYADKPIEHPVTTAWILNPMLNVPANRDNVRSASSFVFGDDGYIQSLFPHMHVRGKNWKFEAIYPDGKTELLLDVPKWDFDWQITYLYKEPKFVPKGTKIRATAVYDNTANNPDNPDPNQNVTWGEATTDEMMLGLMDYIYVTDKDFQGVIGLPDAMIGMLPPEARDLGRMNGKRLREVGSKLGF